MSEARSNRDRRGADRRRGDRRRSERRGPAADGRDQSWFGPPHEGEGEAAAGVDSASNATADAADSQFFFQQARRLAHAGGSAFQRLYRAFLAARAALGLALVGAQALAALLGSTTPFWTLALSGVYALEAVALWLLPRLQRGASAQSLARLSSPRWWLSIGLDLGLFGLLLALDRSAGVSYGALFVLPVLMAGVLTPRLLALATAAMAALMTLGVAWWSVLQGADAGLRMTQAGLVGVGFFVIGLLASELASRLAREERAARGSMELARQQAQLNRLVIDEMTEGVLVVDRRGHVRAANPAARGLLAEQQMVRTAPFQLRGVPAWEPLVAAVEQAFSAGGWPEEGRDVALVFNAAERRALRLRMRFTRRREVHGTEDLCVLFVEDVRNLLARSRQEKLAAMGRISAGIAHEIRNPLAAIDQANALLAEDCADPQSQRLTAMVNSNVQRLKRIVDDVMEVAPGVPPQPVPVDASALVSEACLDWARTNKLPAGPDSPLGLSLPTHALRISFEPEHLRRVLINLLDNALRHATPGPRSVQVSLRAQSEQWVSLGVFSAGELIAPEVERHLFEPFFSTRSRGSGLGLYICRELCERYGGRIDYRSQRSAALGGNEFVVTLRRLPADAPLAPASS
ncbi:sensor histidine kinase [Paucibacter sp. M5-1]|uniref:sensor histidine kinase n=1 Tax=Paucibacter sp. M5-1 TaxID=3015998 RepID=UPI0022B89D6B|nr:ATP-binding protein [Paucibacter sp. M5-1]MCZ7879799.1 ATP-binding protein [Paucibacter sp. M5-1]